MNSSCIRRPPRRQFFVLYYICRKCQAKHRTNFNGCSHCGTCTYCGLKCPSCDKCPCMQPFETFFCSRCHMCETCVRYFKDSPGLDPICIQKGFCDFIHYQSQDTLLPITKRQLDRYVENVLFHQNGGRPSSSGSGVSPKSTVSPASL